MNKKQRNSILNPTLLMQKMYTQLSEPIDRYFSLEMREFVECGFRGAPGVGG